MNSGTDTIRTAVSRLRGIYKIEKEHFSIAKEEVEILKPDVILFLTGPNYDQYIKDKFYEISKICIRNVFLSGNGRRYVSSLFFFG